MYCTYASTHTHIQPSHFSMWLSPPSPLVLHDVFKQLHGSHHSFILLRQRVYGIILNTSVCEMKSSDGLWFFLCATFDIKKLSNGEIMWAYLHF